MPVDTEPAVQLQHLTAQLDNLRAQLLGQQRVRSRLEIKQSVVAMVCNVLQTMKYKLDSTEDALDLDPSSLFDAEDLALLEEHVSHQQPTASSFSSNQTCAGSSPIPNSNALLGPATPSGSFNAAAAMEDGLEVWPSDTISPPEDPLQFFRQLLQRGPLPGTHTITLLELQQQYLTKCNEAGFSMLLLDSQCVQPNWPSRQQCMDTVQQLAHQHLHLWSSLVLHSRGKLLQEFHLSNCLTGEAVEQQDLRPYQWAAQNMDLTSQQMQRIADMLPVFKEVQQAVLDELQQLQQHPVDEPEPSSDEPGSAMLLPMGMMVQPRSSEVSQSQNERRAVRMRVLLRKQHLIGVCCNAYALGCISHLQLARLGLATYPFPAFMYLFATEVEKLVQQQGSH